MKYLLILIIIFLSMTTISYAQQNHVPNGDFEYYTQCPTAFSQTSRCTGWVDFTPSSDYFNCSSLAPNMGAHSGTGYAGAFASTGTNITHAERFSRAIIPLSPGIRYEVSMSVRLAYYSKYGNNNIGVFFYDVGYPSGIPAPQATFFSYGPIMDTANWKRITTTFVADSTYDNIVIGGFYNVNTFARDSFAGGTNYSYYIFDSIVVKIADSFSAKVTDSILCAGDDLNVSYNAVQTYASNNIFTAQLSDKNGSFSSPVNIGTKASTVSGIIPCMIPNNIAIGTGYKVRVVASNPADTTKNISPTLRIGNIDSTTLTISSNSPLCEGETISLTAGSTAPSTTYSWIGPANFISQLPSPTIGSTISANAGKYFATYQFYGCSVTDSTNVIIKPAPVKPVANNNTSICSGSTINLTATTPTPAVTYSWAGPSSFTSSTQNPTLNNSTVGMSGDYIVAADLYGCKRTDTATITVKPLPLPVALSSNSALCAGDTLKLNSTASTTGATYSWTGPNSFAASTQNATIANSAVGMTGWYKMTVDLNACQYKDSTYATIHPIPATPLVGFNNPLCVGETLNLTASTVSGATYSWTGANGFTANTQNPARSSTTTSDAGVYNVRATVNGCTSPAGSATIAINASPFVVIFPTPSDSICQGDPVVFTALPNNAGGTPQYRWMVNAQQVVTGTVFNASTLSNGDVVRCDMTEYTKCSSPHTDQSNDIEMKVLPWLAPSVSISASPNRILEVYEYVTFTATPTNGGSAPLYQWKRNGQNIQGATGSVWSANTLNDNDKITVELISNYKCPQPPTAASNSITVRIATSINHTNAIKGLTLYPNPNNGSFTIKGLMLNNDKISVQVMSGIGQLVYMQDIMPANNTVSENITLDGRLSPGVYFVKLVVNGEARVIPMTVSR